MAGNGALRFACSMCGRQAAEAGPCPACGADALMDIVDPDQRRVLERIDRRRMQKRSNQLKAAAVISGIALGGLLFGVVLAGVAMGGHFMLAWAIRIAGTAVIAGVLWAVFEKLFGDARMYPFLDDPLPKATQVSPNRDAR